MDLYFLDYDLREGRDYQRLYNELARFGAVHMLESLWCLEKDNTTCTALRDHFARFIDPDCRLMISRVSGWTSRRVKATPNDLP